MEADGLEASESWRNWKVAWKVDVLAAVVTVDDGEDV
jgi:hypothetical protein